MGKKSSEVDDVLEIMVVSERLLVWGYSIALYVYQFYFSVYSAGETPSCVYFRDLRLFKYLSQVN
jgi:hypothetical protein